MENFESSFHHRSEREAHRPDVIVISIIEFIVEIFGKETSTKSSWIGFNDMPLEAQELQHPRCVQSGNSSANDTDVVLFWLFG